MGNAIWLCLALPVWYLDPLVAPVASWPLALVPAAGMLGLIIGIVWGLVTRERQLLLFAVPVALSHVLVAIAGLMRGTLGVHATWSILAVFLLSVTIFAAYLLWQLEDARGPGTALAVFAVSYSLLAAFVAGMAFTDEWL